MRRESRENFVCVIRIRHVGVTVEFYAESFHVRNVNGAKQRFEIRLEGNLGHASSFGFRPTFGRKPPMRVVRGRPDTDSEDNTGQPRGRSLRFQAPLERLCLSELLCGNLCGCRCFGA